MSAWLADDFTRWLNCPRCDEVVFETQCGGLTSRLSRFSVPYSHAVILPRYGVCVWNIWRGMSRWFVTEWFPDAVAKPPPRGRLYVLHHCAIRK